MNRKFISGLLGAATFIVVSGIGMLLTAAGTNLITNPSVETIDSANTTLPEAWSKNKWGTNTSSFTYKSDGRTGSKSLYVNISKYTSGDAKWYFAPVAVKPNTSYTFSDYSKSNVSSKLVVQYTSTTGAVTYKDLASIASHSSWFQKTVTFTTPTDVKTMTVYHLISRVGWLQTDDFSLAETNALPANPTVSLTSPVSGSTVSNSLDLVASANNATGVQFQVDDVNVGGEDTTAPYSVNWDSKSVADGNHTVTAVARNSAGVTATATSSIIVSNTSTPPPVVSNNLVANPSFEETDAANTAVPARWLSNSWGANTPVFTYPVAGNGSAKAARVEMTARTDGDAKWYFEPVHVTPGTTYRFTDTYRSNVATELVIVQLDASGKPTYSGFVSVPASSTWKSTSYNFQTASTTKTITVFHVIQNVGWLEMDTVSLSEVVKESGLLPNRSLENPNTDTLPLHWEASSWGTNSPKFEYLNEGRTGTRSVKVTMTNYVDGDAKWLPTPLTTLERGKQYRFSAWYKTNTIPHAVAMYQKDDGTYRFFGMPDPQPNGSSDWQYYSDTFNVPLDAKAVSMFFYINANGYVQTDDYDLTAYTPVGFNRPMVTLTFDDGEEDNETTALPRMNAYGFKSTQCFAVDHIEGNAANTQAVLSFFNSGHEICSHTVSHPFLTKVSPTQLSYELSHSKSVLEGIIGRPVNNFATPYGDYNATVNTEIMKHYKSHRTVDEGYNSKDNFNGYRLRTQNMFYNTTMEQFQGWLDKAKADNTWLILVYHRVANDPGQYDTYISDFDKQLAAIKASGIQVRTYQEALDEIYPQL